MRLQVANYHRLLLMLINLITHGLTVDQRKQYDLRKTDLSSRNSLMDVMMTKFSYPKEEVTAGVGYGHHLHPLYYRGQKEMMYPCAVECGEWETMGSSDDNGYEASSNVDVVTVHPDVSTIDITTTKSRLYKDASLLRPAKKYKSPLFSAATLTTTSSTPKSKNGFGTDQDLKGTDVKAIPQIPGNTYNSENESKDVPNDGSLYAKYYDEMANGYDGELYSDDTEHNEREHFDPMQESARYNPPSFSNSDNDDMDAPVYPTRIKPHPKRERIEEKYIKHNIREEHLEDVRTNSFGSPGSEDYSTNSSFPLKSSNDYENSKYNMDDYAAPIKPYQNENYQEAGFKPSPPLHQGEGRRPPYSSSYNGYNNRGKNYDNLRDKKPYKDSNRYNVPETEDYDEEVETNYDKPPKISGTPFDPTRGNYNFKQGRLNNYVRNHPRFRNKDPRFIKRPSTHGRNRKYPPILNGVAKPHGGPFTKLENSRYPSKYGSREIGLYPENGVGHSFDPYAPRHGYSHQSQEFHVRPKSGGIRVVAGPRIREHPPRYEKVPSHESRIRNRPPFRGKMITYGRIIPRKDGFTKIVKKYRSFVDHSPKRYI